MIYFLIYLEKKVEAIQRRAARWVYRDYNYTSSITAMLKDPNWRSLDQRHIDSCLVAIPASQSLICNIRLSRYILASNDW